MTKDYLCFKNWMGAFHEVPRVQPLHVNHAGQVIAEIVRRGWIHQVLVTSGGDTPITQEAADRLPANIDHWFAANVHVRHPRIHPIPIGIPSDETYGDFSVIEEFRDTPKSKELFACFCLGNNPPERVPAMEQTRLYGDWTVQCFQQNERKLMPHRTFIKEMARHQFVLCPPGAQDSDTHRCWESLYLNCIPVVKRSVFIKAFEPLFPMVVVDDWRDVTPQLLASFKYKPAAFDKRHLTLSYWVDKIKNQGKNE